MLLFVIVIVIVVDLQGSSTIAITITITITIAIRITRGARFGGEFRVFELKRSGQDRGHESKGDLDYAGAVARGVGAGVVVAGETRRANRRAGNREAHGDAGSAKDRGRPGDEGRGA